MVRIACSYSLTSVVLPAVQWPCAEGSHQVWSQCLSSLDPGLLREGGGGHCGGPRLLICLSDRPLIVSLSDCKGPRVSIQSPRCTSGAHNENGLIMGSCVHVYMYMSMSVVVTPNRWYCAAFSIVFFPSWHVGYIGTPPCYQCSILLSKGTSYRSTLGTESLGGILVEVTTVTV